MIRRVEEVDVAGQPCNPGEPLTSARSLAPCLLPRYSSLARSIRFSRKQLRPAIARLSIMYSSLQLFLRRCWSRCWSPGAELFLGLLVAVKVKAGCRAHRTSETVSRHPGTSSSLLLHSPRSSVSPLSFAMIPTPSLEIIDRIIGLVRKNTSNLLTPAATCALVRHTRLLAARRALLRLDVASEQSLEDVGLPFAPMLHIFGGRAAWDGGRDPPTW